VTITVSDRPERVQRLLKSMQHHHPNPGWQFSYLVKPAGTLKKTKTRHAGLLKEFPDTHLSMSIMRNSPNYDHIIIEFRSEKDWPTLVYTKWFDENIRPIIFSAPDEFGEKVGELITPHASGPNHSVWL
jgi:hypothetical protein